MFRFSWSNGITEGFHRKMTLIQHRAYGFRNLENYRLIGRVFAVNMAQDFIINCWI